MDGLLDRYRSYLLRERGLAVRMRLAGRFLAACRHPVAAPPTG